MNAAVNGSVVNYLAAHVVFVALVREEECAPQTGVEGLCGLLIVEFSVDSSEVLFPDSVVLSFYFVKRSTGNFTVDNSLRNFIGNIRGAESIFNSL